MLRLKRLPLIPTLLVLLAVGVMIRLGFWQIERLHQKEALLARYAGAAQFSSDVGPAQFGDEHEAILYRHTAFECLRVESVTAIAGLSAKGASGIAHIARCSIGGGGGVDVTLGWSSNPAPPQWAGGTVAGVIGPKGKTDIRIIADPPLAGLAANARPDPANIANNHLSYAVQWFLFALTALVIYALALRKRLQE